MISTLAKFPWFSVDNYTLTTRDQLFAATRDQIKTLTSTVNRGGLPGLTESLLNDLLMAGLNAHGFSEKQRWELRQAAGFVGSRVAMSPLAQCWPFEALGRKAGVDEDVVEVSGLVPIPLISSLWLVWVLSPPFFSAGVRQLLASILLQSWACSLRLFLLCSALKF